MNARSSSKNLPAVREGADDDPSAAAKALSQILERSTRLQAPAVTAYVERLRRQRPDATPAEIIASLEKHYLAAVMASGATVGLGRRVPGYRAHWSRCPRSPAKPWCSWRRRRYSYSLSPRCTGIPPITASGAGHWCWPCSSARTASTPWPIWSAAVAPARVDLGRGGDAAAAGGVAAQQPAGEVLRRRGTPSSAARSRSASCCRWASAQSWAESETG